MYDVGFISYFFVIKWGFILFIYIRLYVIYVVYNELYIIVLMRIMIFNYIFDNFSYV